jgi:two-component system sensor kinase FixL
VPASEAPRRRFRYGVALAASCAGIGLKLLLGPTIVPSAFLTSYGAVLFSAWYGGLGAGLLATALSVAVGSYLFVPAGPLSEVREVLFIAIATFLSASIAALTQRQRRTMIQRARELEQANATLRDSEERFHQAFEFAPVGMALHTLDGMPVQVNRALCEMLGFDHQELLAKSIPEIVHPGDLQASQQDRERLLSGAVRSYQSERRVLGKDGQVVWAHLNVALLRDAAGQPCYFITHLRNVTRRKRAEEELRASEERFALAVAGARDAIWDWDIEANRLYVSPHWSRVLGLEVRERIFPAEAWLDRVHPDEKHQIVDDLMAHLDGRTPSFESEHRLRHADGSYRWVSSRGLCLRDASGTAYRIAGSVADVSQRKQAEAELREREAQLAHVLRLTTVNQMATGLAHEINQPLAAIVNYAKGCSRRLDGDNRGDGELRHAIERIASEALRAGEIIHRLRQLVRKEPPRRERIDLNGLIADALRFVDSDLRDLAIRVDLDLCKEPVCVDADGVQIEQVVLNLVRNALDAIRAAADGRRELRISTRSVGGVGEVEIRDNGGGLPDGESELIFAPFFTTKTDGLGMGLSISLSIIETHGGRLWARANAEGGACVCFNLPLADEARSYAH